MEKLAQENMSSDLVTIGWNETIDVAYRRMQKQRVRHLPVHNEAGDILGMLSDRDVYRAMISTLDPDGPRPLSGFSDETIEFSPNARVRDYMSWPAKVLPHDADLRLVAERMVIEKVSSILVQNGSRIVGIITAEDLLKVLIEVLSEPGKPYRWTIASLLGGAAAKQSSLAV